MFVVLHYCSLIVPLPVLVRKMILLIRKTAFLSWLGCYKRSKSYRSSSMSFLQWYLWHSYQIPVSASISLFLAIFQRIIGVYIYIYI